jgi:hypothetical protein
MTRTADEIRAVCELAALRTDEAEMAALSVHFEKMFKHLEDLGTVDVAGVEPFFALPFRDLPQGLDRPEGSGVDAAIRGTFAEGGEGFLIVKRVVNRGEEE